ncbi:phage shock protein C (PspC) family protein [Dyadobacter koreensis]|uniref:Phage shock protein C (PspC) family protein n=1 Tax=Dyadobacter koreensis TaxID=408657 RepID=A0A1H7A892_9BACT|nr:PspC domain-containing protein [Dyadobacter koreensis]SEJ61849.1 phage shock protein C (PspC) family protein [Dyadobacter koreensis]
MKKTISINIGGVIFHIEEDGYEKLKSYLNSIQKYFSSFADSKEILSDIEGRIAERFWNKQKSESKQVISLSDVDELIAAMGTVADFEAIEQSEDILSEPLGTAQPKSEIPKEEAYSSPTPAAPKTESKTYAGPKKLVRDLRRKLIGGVASGLANYFTIDPLWVRLAFLLAVLGLPVGGGMMGLDGEFFGGISGFTALVYIAMWIAFPGSTTLEEDTKIKKFYRNPDRKVVGGVASGVASYFGVDLGVVRFLWVISIFLFGTGVILYIVLWVIAPAANTLTEKMEMQGEPITLSNIESNIKQSLNLSDKEGEENPITKILLFPFRAIALIIGALGKLLKGLGPVLRIMIGVFLVGMSVLALFGLVVGGSAVMGITSIDAFDGMPLPFRILQEIPSSLILSGLLVSAIPFITFLLLGLTLLSNKKIVGSTVWLTLLGLWIVGIIVATIQGVSYQQNFAKRGEYTQSVSYAIPAGTLTLDENDADEEENIDIDIRLTGYNATDSLKLDKKMVSRGRTKEIARKLASELQYEPTIKDSVITFNEGPTFKQDGPFRDQQIDLTLNIPFDKQFIITRNLWFSISRWYGSNHHLDSYDLNDDDVNWEQLRWTIKRDSGLVCINLPAKYIRSNDNEDNSSNGSYSYDDEDSDLDMGERGTYIKQFPVKDFRKIDIGGAYSVIVKQGTEFNVSADGEEKDVDDLKIYEEGGVLKVKRSSNFNLFNNDWKRIGIIVTMPTIEGVSLSGANKTRIIGFKGLQKLDVDVSGASKTEIDVETNELTLGLSGASKATLKGSAKSVEIDLSGACKLNGVGMTIQNVDIHASGASKADFGQVANMKKDLSGASKVDFQQ